ncbi:MAG: CPBP family intramembrane glutamic endopeptidase [Gammaproteobacteria bacterium]
MGSVIDKDRADALKTCVAAGFGGTIIFVCLVLFSLQTAQFNATNWPTVPWFPLPVLAAVIAVTLWCDRRWDIGLSNRCNAPVPLVMGFALASNVAAHAVWVLEKSWHGSVYAAPTGPEGVSTLFSATYWIVISIALSSSSEVCFRGIMQTQLSRYLGAGTAIGAVILFNLFSHPWDSLWPRFFGVLAILFAWGWLRYIGGSLKACILTHIAAVMIGDAVFWLTGPVAFGEYSNADRLVVVSIGLVSLALSYYYSRRIRFVAGTL